MGTQNKAANQRQKVKGKVKETAGRIMDDDQMQREGRSDQMKGDMKQAGEKVKDTFRR